MADSQPRKFMFDRSFDNGSAGTHVPERKPVTLKPEQVDALKKEAYEAGLAAGQKTVVDATTDEMTRLLVQLEQRMQHLVENFQTIHKQKEGMVGQIVLAIARKLLPDFAVKNGLQEIQALLGEVIAEMVHEPRLVVRIHESQFDAINTRVTELTAQKAYAGKVVVLADPEIGVGDCRIEWADGGVERDTQTTWRNIETTLLSGSDVAAPLSSEPIQPESTHAQSN